MIELTASRLHEWQSCRRRFLLNTHYQVLAWRPKSLLDLLLRRGIFALSTAPHDPKSLDSLISGLKADYMQAAASPGLECSRAPFQTAKDYCITLETILRSVARLTLLTVTDPAPIQISPALRWRLSSWPDDSGTLHRWITVDRWTADRLLREMHSWETFADIAIAEAPMMLHAIIIGQERDGRRQAAWNRAWRHPTEKLHLAWRFKRKDGKQFNNWKPVFLADHPSMTREGWVDRMFAEGAAQELMQHATVNVPSVSVCRDTRVQIETEALRIEDAIADRAVPWSAWPMSRGACDWPQPCPWQNACYVSSGKAVDPVETGLYARRPERITQPELELSAART